MDKLKIVRKFNSTIDREKFNEMLAFNASNSDVILDEIGYVVTVGDQEAVAIKLGDSTLLVSVPKQPITTSDIEFTNISENQLEFLKNNYNVKKSLVIARSAIFNKEQYIEDIENKKKYKRLHKDSVKTLEDYDRERIIACFDEWKKWFLNRKEEEMHIDITCDFILKVLDEKEKYGTKSVFLEENGKLVAFSIGCKYSSLSKNEWLNFCTYGLKEPRNISLHAKLLRTKMYGDGGCFLDYDTLLNKELTEAKSELARPEKVINQYYSKVQSKV